MHYEFRREVLSTAVTKLPLFGYFTDRDLNMSTGATGLPLIHSGAGISSTFLDTTISLCQDYKDL